MATEIGNICETLSHKKKCPLCGGNIVGSSCSFCKKEIPGSKELINQLNTSLTGQVNLSDFPSLVNIKDLQIPSVSEYITGNTENFRHQIASGIANQNYDDIIKFLGAQNHRDVIQGVDGIFPYIVRDYFDGKLFLDDDTYLQFIKAYADRVIQNSEILHSDGKCPSVEFASASEMPDLAHGLGADTDAGGKILFNRDSFLDCRDQYPYFNLRSIYHELQHVGVQSEFYTNPDRFNLTGFLIAEDNAIRPIKPSYYDENYTVLPVEADADFASYQSLNADLMFFGRELPGVRDKLKHYGELRINSDRTYNGNKISADELFEQLNINPIALAKYPVLNLIYENVDGKIVKKDKERLMEALQSEKNPAVANIYRHALGLEYVQEGNLETSRANNYASEVSLPSEEQTLAKPVAPAEPTFAEQTSEISLPSEEQTLVEPVAPAEPTFVEQTSEVSLPSEEQTLAKPVEPTPEPMAPVEPVTPVLANPTEINAGGFVQQPNAYNNNTFMPNNFEINVEKQGRSR